MSDTCERNYLYPFSATSVRNKEVQFIDSMKCLRYLNNNTTAKTEDRKWSRHETARKTMERMRDSGGGEL